MTATNSITTTSSSPPSNSTENIGYMNSRLIRYSPLPPPLPFPPGLTRYHTPDALPRLPHRQSRSFEPLSPSQTSLPRLPSQTLPPQLPNNSPPTAPEPFQRPHPPLPKDYFSAPTITPKRPIQKEQNLLSSLPPLPPTPQFSPLPPPPSPNLSNQYDTQLATLPSTDPEPPEPASAHKRARLNHSDTSSTAAEQSTSTASQSSNSISSSHLNLSSSIPMPQSRPESSKFMSFKDLKNMKIFAAKLGKLRTCLVFWLAERNQISRLWLADKPDSYELYKEFNKKYAEFNRIKFKIDNAKQAAKQLIERPDIAIMYFDHLICEMSNHRIGDKEESLRKAKQEYCGHLHISNDSQPDSSSQNANSSQSSNASESSLNAAPNKCN